MPIRVSGKRLAANRANALKSKGPKTDAGKRRSSQNACNARKFRMPDPRENWAVQRAHEFAQTIDDPDLRPLILQRFYINGRQKYFIHLCLEFLKQVEQNGMAWYFANSDRIAALDRYHAHHYAETLRITRLIRRYHQRSPNPSLPLAAPRPLTRAAGQTLFSRLIEPIFDTPAPAPRSSKPISSQTSAVEQTHPAQAHTSPRPIKPISPQPAAAPLSVQVDQTHFTRAIRTAAGRLTMPRPPPPGISAAAPDLHRASSRSLPRLPA